MFVIADVMHNLTKLEVPSFRAPALFKPRRATGQFSVHKAQNRVHGAWPLPCLAKCSHNGNDNNDDRSSCQQPYTKQNEGEQKEKEVWPQTALHDRLVVELVATVPVAVAASAHGSDGQVRLLSWLHAHPALERLARVVLQRTRETSKCSQGTKRAPARRCGPGRPQEGRGKDSL